MSRITRAPLLTAGGALLLLALGVTRTPPRPERGAGSPGSSPHTKGAPRGERRNLGPTGAVAPRAADPARHAAGPRRTEVLAPLADPSALPPAPRAQAARDLVALGERLERVERRLARLPAGAAVASARASARDLRQAVAVTLGGEGRP